MSIKTNSQPNIIPGTITDYYRGDKTFQPLDKTAVGLVNVPNLDTSTTANIADIATKRFTSDVEKTAQSSINSTQTATNSTQATINTAQIATNTAQATTNANTVTALLSKEDVSNKQTNLASSSTKYPTVDAVNTGLALKQNAFNATIISATFFDTIPPVAGLIYTSTFTGTLTGGQNVARGQRYSLINNQLEVFSDKKNALILKNNTLKFGAYQDRIANPQNLTDLRRVEDKLSYNSNNKFKFYSINRYGSAFYQNAASFAGVSSGLDEGYVVNYFPSFDFSGSPDPAQLANVKNGTYDAKFTIFLDNLVNYWEVANPTKTPIETRLCYGHEWNGSSSFEWAMGYNQVNTQDWYSTALVTPALGRNDPADYIPAMERIGNLIKAHPAYTKGYVKRCLVTNSVSSQKHNVADFIPSRDTYDYLGIDVYDFFNEFYKYSSLYTCLAGGQNRIYSTLAEVSDAPIIIGECGSVSEPTQNNVGRSANAKYHRIKYLTDGINDITKYMPKIVELSWFDDSSTLFNLSDSDLKDFRRLINDPDYRISSALSESRTANFNPNLLTKDLSYIGNWTAGGANAGTLRMYTNTDSPSGSLANGGLDGGLGMGRIGKKTLAINYNGGTLVEDNHIRFTEKNSILKDSTFTASFYAYNDKNDAKFAFGMTGDSNYTLMNGTSTTNFSGTNFIKAKKGWNKYSVTFFYGYFPTPTNLNFIWMLGGQSYYTTLPVLTPTITAGAITAVTITSAGSGIEDGSYNLVVTGANTTPANIQVRVTGGVVVSSNISAAGAGYVTPTLDLQPRVFMLDVDSIKIERGEVSTQKLLIDTATPAVVNARVVSVTTLTKSGLQTVDGLALNEGDIVLEANPTALATNGLWKASSGVWTRLYINQPLNQEVKIQEGSVYSTTTWSIKNNAAVVQDITAQTWTYDYQSKIRLTSFPTNVSVTGAIATVPVVNTVAAYYAGFSENSIITNANIPQTIAIAASPYSPNGMEIEIKDNGTASGTNGKLIQVSSLLGGLANTIVGSNIVTVTGANPFFDYAIAVGGFIKIETERYEITAFSTNTITTLSNFITAYTNTQWYYEMNIDSKTQLVINTPYGFKKIKFSATLKKWFDISNEKFLQNPIPLYATNAAAIADATLATGSQYYVVVGGLNQVFVK